MTDSLRQGRSHDDTTVDRLVRAAPVAMFDGRLPGHIWAHVTDIDDPEGQGRIKCTWYFQQEEGVAEMETDWITRIVPWNGPTKMSRGRIFGFNPPHPEVGSRVVLACMSGDPHDLILVGQPEYLQDDTGAPPSEKDDHIDWAFRMRLQNGWEWGIDSEGNEYKTTPGNYRHKVGGSSFQSARGIWSVWGVATRIVAAAMNRLIGAKVETSNYLTPEEEVEVRKMSIDAMDFPPGYKDPGIGKIADLND
jgi:hypothetical protein